jgi:hypothetical protein
MATMTPLMGHTRLSIRIENRSQSSRAARWNRKQFDVVAETSHSRIILRARTFFTSSLTTGARSSYRMPSWTIFQIRRHSRWAIAPMNVLCFE